MSDRRREKFNSFRAKNTSTDRYRRNPTSTVKSGADFISTDHAPAIKKSVIVKKDGVLSLEREEKTCVGPSVIASEIITDVTDILLIDKQIKNNILSKISIISDLQTEIGNMTYIVTNSKDTCDKVNAKSRISLLKKQLKDIEGGFEFAYYILITSHIIDEYKKILSKNKERSFVRIGSVVTADERRKNELIFNFLRIAKDYITLTDFVQTPQRLVCNAYNEEKKAICECTSFTPNEDNSIYSCEDCGANIEILDDKPAYKDTTDRVNMTNKYVYTTKGHFSDAIANREATENIIIPQSVINTLETAMKNHGLTKDDPNADTFVSRDHIYLFLTEKRLSDYYGHVYRIHFMITGIPPDSISKYKEDLLEMFDIIEKVYQQVKDPDRDNSMHVIYKLYKLLQLLNYPCKKDDFHVLRTQVKLNEHDDKWNEMMEILKEQNTKYQWKWIPTR